MKKYTVLFLHHIGNPCKTNNLKIIILFMIIHENKSQSGITCLKLTIEKLEQGVKSVCRFGVFIVNFEDLSHLVLVFLLLTLSR